MTGRGSAMGIKTDKYNGLQARTGQNNGESGRFRRHVSPHFVISGRIGYKYVGGDYIIPSA